MMSLFRRAPDVEVTVRAGKSDTAVEALAKMNLFSLMVQTHDLTIVSTKGSYMTLKGRPKQVAAFKAKYDAAQAAKLV